MKHLLVAYSWSMGNIGDIGITPGLLNLLQRHAPELPVTVMTSQNKGSKEYSFLKDYFLRYSPGCIVVANPFLAFLGRDLNTRSSVASWNAFMDRWGEIKLKAFQNGCLAVDETDAIIYDILNIFPLELIQEYRRIDPDSATALADAGFVIFTSGTTLNFGRMGKRDFWNYSFKHALPLIIARAYGIPYGISSQSFDALEWPADVFFRRLFADAEFVYCRDTDSLAYLQQKNIICKRMDYRPDTTFFFDGADEMWADEYMTRTGLEAEHFITVTIRTSTQPGPLLGVMTKEREQIHMAKMRAFIEEWVARTGLKVLLCPESSSEIQAAKELLYDQVASDVRAKCVWMNNFWSSEQAYSIYKKARIVVSMEMHSIIMSVSIGTPFLHPQFAESGRKARMVRDIGLGDWLFDIDAMDPHSLVEAAISINAQHESAKKRVTNTLHRLDQLGAGVIMLVKQRGYF